MYIKDWNLDKTF